jgi:hypothetical protein
MPGDRLHRDAAANALGAFLRGEIDKGALHKRLRAIVAAVEKSKEEDKELLPLCMYLQVWDLDAVSLQDWERLVRTLAFLQSDVEPKPRGPAPPDPDEPRLVRLARWHLLGLMIGLGIGYFVGWWLPVACWVASFLYTEVSVNWRHTNGDQAEDTSHARKATVDPFESEEAWLAHRHLVEAHRLPAYNPSIHYRPRNPSAAENVFRPVAFWFATAMLAGFLGLMLAWSLLAWPVYLVLASLPRLGGERREVTSP